MPGPCNIKKKRKSQAHKAKKAKVRRSLETLPLNTSAAREAVLSLSEVITPQCNQPLTIKEIEVEDHKVVADAQQQQTIEIVPQTPYIHDPGNGPRVRDTRTFLTSFFAHPPSLEDPLCAEFAQEEVLQMLMTVLPEETALVPIPLF